MSNLTTFAEREVRAAGLLDKDSDYEGELGKDVLELVRVFADQGHSGMSASFVTQLFGKLARYQPLSPLTGEDDEWNEVGEGVFQNKRCSTVFRENGEAYNIDGRVFREPSGVCYTNRDSRVHVSFPYTPTTEYVDVTGQPV